MKKLCIYHANCLDGFAAAWVVNTKYMGEVDFVPANYGDTPPDVTNRDVIIVDFSYPREVMELVMQFSETLVVLDHHKTAEAELNDLGSPHSTIIFDKEKSGALLAWNYFMGGEPPPIVQHVCDRDLWYFDDENTEEFCANLASMPREFQAWNAVDKTINNQKSYATFVSHGNSIMRSHSKIIDDLIATSATMETFDDYEGIPTLNCIPVFASEAGHRLSKESPFSVTNHREKNYMVYSLRSRKDGGADVSEIAKRHGGGGHEHAAGFKLLISDE